MAVVAPVPPSPIASVPVIELESNFKASLPPSKAKPPLAFVSTNKVFPDLSRPAPAII